MDLQNIVSYVVNLQINKRTYKRKSWTLFIARWLRVASIVTSKSQPKGWLGYKLTHLKVKL